MILDSKMALYAATQIIKEHLHKPIIGLSKSEQKDLFRAYAYLSLELGTRGLIDMVNSLAKQIEREGLSDQQSNS